jgi:hypothetical protein
MHDQELLRRAQYDQDNGPPDNLYVIPADRAPLASPGEVNNFQAFSRRLWTISIPKTSSLQLRSTTVALTRVYGSKCIV